MKLRLLSSLLILTFLAPSLAFAMTEVSEPVEITPGTTGSFQTVDLTAYFGSDAGNVAGVVLQISLDTVQTIGFQHPDSTDNNTNTNSAGQFIAYVGVNSNDEIELYTSSATDVNIYLRGYFTNDEGACFTNVVDKSIGTNNAWTDIDISSNTGSDTALYVMGEVHSIAASRNWGVRNNGSTDSRLATVISGDIQGFAIGVDGSEIFEHQTNDVVNVDLYVSCYLTDNVTAFTNGVSFTGSSATYVDVDVSGSVPAGNDGAFFHPFDTNSRNFALRKNGETHDVYNLLREHTFWWVPLDANRVAEQKMASTIRPFLYLNGYTNTAVAGGQNNTRTISASTTAPIRSLNGGSTVRGVIFTGTDVTTEQVIMQYGSTLNFEVWEIRIEGGKLEFFHRTSGFSSNGGRWSAGSLATNTQYTFCVTAPFSSSTADPNIWIDGVDETVTEEEAPTTPANNTGYEYLYIGGRIDNTAMADADIGEIAIIDEIIDGNFAANFCGPGMSGIPLQASSTPSGYYWTMDDFAPGSTANYDTYKSSTATTTGIRIPDGEHPRLNLTRQ